MITIIFIAYDGEPVNIMFSRNELLNTTHKYGKWNTYTNSVELNDNGWRIFETCRDEIRKLKPMLEQLEKFHD
jgi:hypothetical protein